MTTREYLNQANDLERKINILKREIEKMRMMVTSISVKTDGDRVQSSGSYDLMADSVARIVDRERTLAEMINLYMAKKDEIESNIVMMDNKFYSDVLYGRYIAGLTFYELSYQIGKQRRQTINIHNKAVNAFENQFKEVYCDKPKSAVDISLKNF